MEQQILTTLSPDDMVSLIKKSIREVHEENVQAQNINRSYSFNQVAKELGRSFTTVKKLITEGKLKTTADGRRIPAQELNNYMKSPG